LYHEPAFSDKITTTSQKMFGVDTKKFNDLYIRKKREKDLLKQIQIKKDQTNIKLPNQKTLD